MKRFALTAFFGLLATCAINADQVFYDTTATVFNCSNGGSLSGCGTNTIVLGGTLQLMYVGTTTSVTVDPLFPTTNANFGYLQASCLPSTPCDFQLLPKGISLALFVNETGPDSGNGVIPTGNLSGPGISGTSSATFIQWDNTAFLDVTGGAWVTYSLKNTTLGIVSPASCDSNGQNCGQTTLQGTITDVSA